LTGGIIIAGLMGIVALFSKIAENIRLADMEIANSSNMVDLMKEQIRLQQDLTKLKKEYNSVKETRPVFADTVLKKRIDEYAKRLKEVQERIKSLNSSSGTNQNFNIDKSLADLLKSFKTGNGDLDSVLKKRQEIEEQARIALETGRQQDLDNLKFNYDKQIAAAEEVGAKTADITEKYRQDILDINAKYDAEEFEQQQQAQQEAQDAYIAELENELDAEEELYKQEHPWKYAIDQAVKDWGDYSQQVQDISTSTADSMQQAFSDFFVDAMHGELNSFTDYFQSFLDGLIKAWADAVSKMIAQKMLLNLFGVNSTPTVSANASTTTGNYAGTFADGGYIPAGSWGITGEAGPELTYGGKTGVSVIPQSSNQSNVQINIINNSGAKVTQNQRQGSNGANIRDIIIGTVSNGISNNVGGLGDIVKATAAG
jgi:lambda family phage tail tape measure protein